MNQSAAGEAVSPELVLVDPALAVRAHTLRTNRWAFAGEPERRPVSGGAEDGVLLVRAIHQGEREAALRRIVELADVELPAPKRTFRVPKLVGAFATWAVAGIVAIDAFLPS